MKRDVFTALRKERSLSKKEFIISENGTAVFCCWLRSWIVFHIRVSNPTPHKKIYEQHCERENRSFQIKIINFVPIYMGTAVAQWLRSCATNREVAGSIPDNVIAIFYWHNPSYRTLARGSTQPPTEMSTRSISWG